MKPMYWKIIGDAPKRKNLPYVLCECICGTVREVQKSTITTGKSVSCGCYKTECLIERSTIHGDAHSPTYKSWRAMLGRCYDVNSAGYKAYGQQGIQVTQSWHNYEAFKKDMGERPIGTELDRINPNEDYCKENCMWNIRSEAHRNRRCTHQYKGKLLFIHEVAKLTGIPAGTLSGRMSKYNLTLEEAVVYGSN